LLAALVALLVARIPVIFVRAFDNDEFEHAHAAWSLFKGLLPYRDFFEHHTPWYYFMLSPFLRWFAVDQSFAAARHFLIFGRLLSLALTALGAALVFLVGRLGAGRRQGLLASLFFVGQPILIHKTLEIRPDVPAVVFFAGALWFLLHGLRADEDPRPRQLGWFAGGGLCLGAAVMCTQKLLFVLPGAFLGLGLWTLGGGRRVLGARASAVAVALAGVAAPVVVTWVWFALRGGGAQFIYNNFILNAHWRLRSGRHLSNALETSWPVLLLCSLGAWRALSRDERAEPRAPGDLLLFCTLAGVAVGIAVVPAAYEQYYLPLLTVAGVFAARGLAFLLEAGHDHGRAWLAIGGASALLLWPIVDLARAFGRRDDVQMARLQFVFAHTRPSDPVLDGWLGTNVFRPSPFYYQFMHGELMAMLTASQKDAYLGALESGKARPALITLDDELRAFGPRFLRFLHAHYASDDGLFYLPVQPPPASSPSR
jgi:4-amino-4-deoxy-L-arabinose transferase-like glycosyltransferase